MHVVRFRCPEPRRFCRRGVPVAVHTTGPEQAAASIDHAACRHITPAERVELATGTVPNRLAVRGDR
ncbi:hypothetical protein LN042_11590 [Kitasatospora sp. RB6PN24]|uniref:hypothetical protein n=1 Tax=Kitasatospora humi TaxID=2893891 RepID=UPI001E40F38E|nr:hypothetical protein [Kitasatospora humi]MCC9307732.1 hypothetical protein [Kitasatospora humi]